MTNALSGCMEDLIFKLYFGLMFLAGAAVIINAFTEVVGRVC